MPTGYSKLTGENPFKGKKRPVSTIIKMKKPKSEQHRLNVISANTGKKRSQVIKDKFSKMRKGIPKSLSFRKHLSEIQKGDKSHFWKGGKTKESSIIRGSLEYKLWREAVFKRDNYTCIWCEKKGGYLEADHIKPFAYYPELRFAIDNGRTLCLKCHETTETYKRKYNPQKYD
jgi:5-methylcytosine-specific restriction endonuclease McrA